MFHLLHTFFILIFKPPPENYFDPSRWFFFFVFRDSPSFYKISIPKNSFATRLPTFGFEKNGRFSAEICGENIGNVFFMFVPQELDFSSDQFCKSNISFDSIYDNKDSILYNSYDINSNTKKFWNGTIDKKGVYIPFLINCNADNSPFTSISSFENPDVFDYREKGISFILKCLAQIYPVFSVLWVLNGLLYNQFFVDLHHYLSFLPLFKAGILFLESELYNNKSIDPVDVAWSLAASVVLHTALIVLLCVIFSGWCTYEESFPVKDFVIYSVLSFITGCSSALSNYLEIFRYVYYASLLLIVFMVLSSYYKITSKLSQANENTDLNQVKKLTMVLKFMNYCILNISFFSGLNLLALHYNVYPIFRILIVEFGILNLFIIQMLFFFYRSDHVPIITSKPKIQIDKCIQSKFVVLIEPQNSHKISPKLFSLQLSK